MPDDAEQRRDLIQLITTSFDGVPRENGITLREADEIDNRSDEAERAYARNLDADESWQQVEPALIERYSSALFYLDARGFRYYLPAVMAWSVQHAHTSDSSTPDNLLCLLADEQRQRWCDQLLTPEQRQAVASFVEFMLRTYSQGPDDDHTRSLRSYWLG
jgi:hypothetical protein